MIRWGLKRCLIVLALAAAVSFLPGNAFALQGIAPSGPIGGTDINQALMPPPGVYGGLVFGNINYKAWVNADESESDTYDNCQIVGIGVSYVWPFKIFGGSVMTTASAAYEDCTWYMEGAGLPADNYSGVTPLYTDVFFWGKLFPSEAFGSQKMGPLMRPYGLGLGIGFGLSTPTGDYDANDLNCMGSDNWTYSPSIALTYTMPSLLPEMFGDATQFSGRLFYNIQTWQPDKHYKNGNILNLDYAVTQMKGNWQYGINGTYYVQVTDDSFSDGFAYYGRSAEEWETLTRMWSLGPIVSYNFTLNGHPFAAKFKYCHYIKGRNTGRTSVMFLSIGTKF